MASQTPAVSAISAAELARTPGSARRYPLVGVRRPPTFVASQHSICGSLDRRQPPKELAR
jgi:hypothetical protein